MQALNLRRNQVVMRMLSDLERQGAKPLDFVGFLDLMTAKMGERETQERMCQRSFGCLTMTE